MKLKDKKIAIVCDWIKDMGGAELVLEQIMDIFPQADIFTSIFWQKENPIFKNRKITTSFIQKLPFLNKSHKLALTLRPLAFESFDLSKYDIVISLSSAESKGVITKPGCLHICYCHTPTRYFWSHYHEYLHYMEFGLLNPILKFLMPSIIHKLRTWDFCAAQRPDYFIANSRNTASRIKKYYGRKSEVIYPCIDIKSFPSTLHSESTKLTPTKGGYPLKKESPLVIPDEVEIKDKNKDYYIYIGRCIPYKKFDLIVDSFNENGKNIIILTNTDNKLYKELKSRSKSNIIWKLNTSENEKIELLSNAKALLFPPEEDFGLVPIEAMACGTPVIAYSKGGALETVVDGKTGIFFKNQTVESLNEAIEKFETLKFDSKKIRKHSEKFDKKVFKEKLLKFIESKI